jgi:SAM-dependent methyltransferase
LPDAGGGDTSGRGVGDPGLTGLGGWRATVREGLEYRRNTIYRQGWLRWKVSGVRTVRGFSRAEATWPQLERRIETKPMCVICQAPIATAELEAFGSRFLELLNHASAALMISVGHRVGLFEAMRCPGAATRQEISDRAGLNERYVREWLGAMTSAGIVRCDIRGERFELPAAHRALLTGEPGADNLAPLSQYFSVLGQVEDRIVECFRQGGGVPYEAYGRFHDVMMEDSDQSVVRALTDQILPLIPGIMDRLRAGIRVLDVGCGRGSALHRLAGEFPASTFLGCDLSAEAISFARGRAREAGLGNLEYEVRDLSDFDQTAPVAAYDLITAFDAVHDQARPDRLLAGVRRALGVDGVFLMQDIGASSNVAENRDHPVGTLLYTISCMHCMSVSLAQGGLGVGAMWGEQQTREFLRLAGFGTVERHTLAHDLQNYYYVVRP